MPNQAPPQASPPRALRWAVAGSVIVMIAAGGLFYYASKMAAAKRQVNHDEVLVTIHPHSCEPNALSVPAVRASFRIVNRSDRAVEWEILDGVLVVEERENIAPGLSQVINANLLPGDYAITCGLLSNPRGTLHVTPTAASDAAAKAKPSMVAFVGPLSEFRVYLSSQSSALIKAVAALEQAIAAGDLSQAQALYVPARAAYQRIAPAAQRLAELDNAINARADYFEKREQDPAFSGFHRIEYALFQQRNLDALAPVAQRLNSDGEEERYSHTDLNGFAANLFAARKVVDLLRPLLTKSATELLPKIDSAITALDAELNGLKVQDGYASYDTVSAAQRKQIADKAKALADALDGIDPALGLSGL